jgi:hypothetical protein
MKSFASCVFGKFQHNKKYNVFLRPEIRSKDKKSLKQNSKTKFDVWADNTCINNKEPKNRNR